MGDVLVQFELRRAVVSMFRRLLKNEKKLEEAKKNFFDLNANVVTELEALWTERLTLLTPAIAALLAAQKAVANLLLLQHATVDFRAFHQMLTQVRA